MKLLTKIKLCLEIFKCKELHEKGTALFIRGYHAGYRDAQFDRKEVGE